jgi:thiamine-phosphate pyrophosphorylase
LIQLRAKALPSGRLLDLADRLVETARPFGARVIVNDRADVALALGAAGVHLGQDDGPLWLARRVLGPGIVGLSTHSAEQIDAAVAADPRPDYIAVGPVHATPTKPGRPAAGLGPVWHAAARASLPWFAIGGLDRSSLPVALEAGARRAVVVRAITEADDPPAAAAELRAMLDAAPA